MAVLQKIRNKAGIFVIIFVGVALFLFIIDPSTFQVLFQQQDTNVAKINKKKVDYNEFQQHYNYHQNFVMVMQGKNNVTAEEDQRLRQLAWNEILQERIFEPNIKEVGLDVSDEEMEDLLYGSNIHYIIQQYFTNQQTGMIDTTWVRNFFDRAEEDAQTYVIAEYFKRIIKQDRTSAKYDNMVSKGFYVPVAFAEMDYMERNNLYDFELIAKNYRDIPDDNVQYTESELKKYYEDHKYMYYEPREMREIEYVVFDIVPSAEDTASVRSDIRSLYSEFNELAEGHNAFAYNNDDLRTPDFFISQNEMPYGLPEGFYDEPVGTTSDIILDGNTYYFTRIVEEDVRPDSVMLSHILFLVSDTLPIEDVRIKADSIRNLAQAGEDFSLLAYFNSDDEQSKVQGGEMGWFTENNLRRDISDLVFNGNVGDVELLETDYGIHLFKITDQPEKHRKVKLATVNKVINFSEQTANKRFSEASYFVMNNNTGESFDQAIIDGQLIKRIASLGELDSRVSNIEDARNIVKWAYGKDVNVGTVSEVFNFPDKYIVAKVSSIRPKGTSPYEFVADRVQDAVIKEKKAQNIIQGLNNDMNSNTTISALAQKNNMQEENITSLSFSSFSIPGIGTEPRVNGVFPNIPQNTLSSPIQGNNGVYVINVTNSTPAPEKTDFTTEQLNLMRTQAGQVYRISEALEKRAKIEDYRARFF